jgi:magnesium chelatase family protein
LFLDELPEFKRTYKCSPMQIERSMGRTSWPLLDRIALHIEAPAARHQKLAAPHDGTSSAAMQMHVQNARDVQTRRFGGRLARRALRQAVPDAEMEGASHA